MIGDFPRFDMYRRPRRQGRMWLPIIWAVAFARSLAHRSRIDRSGLPRDLKPPYFLLVNHNAFLDIVVATKAIYPHRANYVIAIDGFIGIERLLRAVGGIGTRKFTLDIALVKNMLAARKFGDVIMLFPEARYSLCGTGSLLPESVGKMVRQMNLPVVTLTMHGHHVDAPTWHGKTHGVRPVMAEMTLQFTREETRSLSVDEINARLAQVFTYDDFAWQKANKIKVRNRRRAEGLHRLLYQCAACGTEYEMASAGVALSCGRCGKSWSMGVLGDLRAESGPTEFAHIPDWYEWQRANVRREVEAGTYGVDVSVRIEALPNAKRFVPFPEPGRLVHGLDGFTLTGVCQGEPFTVRWPVSALYGCHIEYDYKGRGDCVDLNTLDDTFYLFPQEPGVAVTKIALATEELYRLRARTRELAATA